MRDPLYGLWQVMGQTSSASSTACPALLGLAGRGSTRHAFSLFSDFAFLDADLRPVLVCRTGQRQ